MSFASLLAGCLLIPTSGSASAQQLVQNQPSPTSSAKRTPVTLAHCYWHFLMYQNHLDLKAVEQAAEGKDGTRFSGLLQASLALSDSDFAPIRTSSARLAAEVNALNARAAAIAAAKNPTGSAQLVALTIERETDINAEVSYIRNTLGTAKTAAFEAFLTQMFAPKTVAIQVPVSSTKPASTAVQP
jgi:hypothetical protein